MSKFSARSVSGSSVVIMLGTNVEVRNRVDPSPSLLIVDDYADALDVWEVYLRAAGFRVLTAIDGPSAFDEAVREKPDVIVMDLELPGKSGFEVARELKARQDTRGIPLIAATGYSHVKQLDLARESGFDTVIVKPCDPQSLVAEIRRLLHLPTEATHLE
jgi:two-component system, cell cycle response regulator DivK